MVLLSHEDTVKPLNSANFVSDEDSQNLIIPQNFKFYIDSNSKLSD